MRRSLLLVVISLALSACTSLRKQADEHFEKGSYDEAVRLYDAALADDPSDTSAVAGRAKAREKLIDTQLITVRHSRLGGNAQNALDLLLDIVLKENQWSTFPKGAVASTQEDESAEAFTFVRGQAAAAVRAAKPLRAYVLLTRYRPIFAGKLLGAWEREAALLKAPGMQSCRKLAGVASAQTPYYGKFVATYCSLWSDQSTPIASTARKLPGLFKNVRAQVAIAGLPEGTEGQFAAAVESAFTKTAWFDPSSEHTLNVAVRGRYDDKETAVREVRTHQYSVAVPYTAFEQVTKFHQVPYTTMQPECSYDYEGNRVCRDVPRTSYRSESYYETVPVTRYRPEPRFYDYEGVLRSRHLSLTTSTTARFGAHVKQFSTAEKSHTSGFEHGNNLPNIGLAPADANLQDSLEWVKEQSSSLADRFEKESNALWEQQYCRPLAPNQSLALQADQVQRCLRRKPEPVPGFVASWYQNVLGVTVEDADGVLGTRKSE